MAMTSKYGFKYRRHLTPGIETPATLEVILGNTQTVVIGDLVRWSSGYLLPVTTATAANGAILGVLVGLVTSKGENIFKTKDAITGTKTGDDTYVSSGTNTTVDQVKGVVMVDPMALFQAYSSTALTQAYVGLFQAATNADGTGFDSLTGTPGAWSTGTQQMQLVELMPTLLDGTTTTAWGLYRIGRSQLLNDYAL